MTRFVVSDHHFDHENIIGYCDRPFDTKSEMNRHMIDQWNEVVDDDDVVIHVGDVAFGGGSNTAQWFLDQLNGNKVVLLGNHDDSITPDSFSYPVFESTVYQHHGFRFWCTHRPDEVPDYWTEWIIHGHVHNDEPLIDYQNNKLNVSVENVGYTPIPLDQLVKTLKNMSGHDKLGTVHDEPFCNNQWYTENIE